MKNGKDRVFVEEAVQYTCQEILRKYADSIDSVLAKTIGLELKRLEKYKKDKAYDFWKNQQNNFSKANNQEDYWLILNYIVSNYCNELVGEIHKPTVNISNYVLSWLFKFFFKPSFDAPHSWYNFQGPINQIKILSTSHPIIFLPTHQSSFDALVIGHLLDKEFKLSPIYHIAQFPFLFRTILHRFFLSRVGTYPIDWEKKNFIYMMTLDSLFTYSIFKGRNVLFYPSGRLSISGKIELKIKRGLIRSSVKAQTLLYNKGYIKSILIVPVVINYTSVPGALKKFLHHINKKEIKYESKSRFKRLVKILSYRSEVHLSFGEPIDLVKNKILNKREYGTLKDFHELQVFFNKVLQNQPLKNKFEKTVTAQLVRKVLENYLRLNLILACHAVAFVLIDLMKKKHPGESDEKIISAFNNYSVFDKQAIILSLSSLKKILLNLEQDNKLRLSKGIKLNTEKILNLGFHQLRLANIDSPIQYINPSTLASKNLGYLYYLSNRLATYGIILNNS